MTNLFDLTGKVAVITGASSGLGADAALAFAQAGANVAILARRAEKLEEVKNSIAQTGRDVIAVSCDVTNEKSVANAMDEVLKHFGTIDILVNNAGIAIGGGVDTLSVEEWDKAFDANCKGIFLASKYVIPTMKEKGYGKIINIASVNSIVANKAETFTRHSYNASKSAVLGLTTGMAATYAKYGITVNAVGPALFESEMTAGTLFKSDEFLKGYSYLTPADRPGKKGELNGTLIYLASDASSYVQGQFILVDGGFSIV